MSSRWNNPGDEIDGATPLDPDEREGLLLPHVQTRAELNVLEQENIQQAEEWLVGQRKHRDLFTRDFLHELHRRMFGEVWAWAGTPRLTEKNIGVDPLMIGVETRNLLDDASMWAQTGVFPVVEFAARFHHRLVKIHVFPNGNGRHARLMTEVLVQRALGGTPPRWRGARNAYLAALRAADGGDLAPLIGWMENDPSAGAAGDSPES